MTQANPNNWTQEEQSKVDVIAEKFKEVLELSKNIEGAVVILAVGSPSVDGSFGGKGFLKAEIEGNKMHVSQALLAIVEDIAK